METIFRDYGDTLAAVEDNGNRVTYHELFCIADGIWGRDRKAHAGICIVQQYDRFGGRLSFIYRPWRCAVASVGYVRVCVG